MRVVFWLSYFFSTMKWRYTPYHCSPLLKPWTTSVTWTQYSDCCFLVILVATLSGMLAPPKDVSWQIGFRGMGQTKNDLRILKKQKVQKTSQSTQNMENGVFSCTCLIVKPLQARSGPQTCWFLMSLTGFTSEFTEQNKSLLVNFL